MSTVGKKAVQEMKMGAFCKRFLTSEYTVRLYIKRGLLVPEMGNKQYIFTEATAADMEMILQMKNCGFTLEEIHGIVSLYRISGFAAVEDLEQLQDIFRRRSTALKREMQVAHAHHLAVDSFLGELESEDANG